MAPASPSLHKIRFIDDAAQGFSATARRSFPTRNYSNREQRRIFDQSWLYAGHESEVPQAGDFLTRRVGGRPLIHRARGRRPDPHFSQQLPPSGATVCRHPRQRQDLRVLSITPGPTTTKADWTASLKDAYGRVSDGGDGSLRVARTQNYRGWLFVCFSR